jgi:hypothetical protein
MSAFAIPDRPCVPRTIKSTFLLSITSLRFSQTSPCGKRSSWGSSCNTDSSRFFFCVRNASFSRAISAHSAGEIENKRLGILHVWRELSRAISWRSRQQMGMRGLPQLKNQWQTDYVQTLPAVRPEASPSYSSTVDSRSFPPVPLLLYGSKCHAPILIIFSGMQATSLCAMSQSFVIRVVA